MIAVAPFVLTMESKKFKDFLSVPFTLDMLYPIYGNNSCITLFNGWHGKDMINWYKFTDDNKNVLEFYPKYYTIKKNEQNFIITVSTPKTIDEFINDMYRFEVKLYWTMWIDFNFEPKEYLQINQIKPYFKELLDKMGKKNELL